MEAKSRVMIMVMSLMMMQDYSTNTTDTSNSIVKGVAEARYHYHKAKPAAKATPPPPLPPPPPADDDEDDGDGDGDGSSPPQAQPPQGSPPAQAVVPSDPAQDPTTTSPPPMPVVPSDPVSPSSCLFDVMEFGAVGDGSADDTAAFREAWKAACAVEGGVIVAPANYCFKITSTIFSGPCKPGLVFQLDGLLMPPDGPDQWPQADSRKQWLVFYRLDNMTFAGSGSIQGSGHNWWDMPCKPHRGPNGSTMSGQCDSPALIRFFMSSNLVVRGLSINNSPQFHMKFDGCRGVLIDGLSISSPKLSPNTDGIHIQDTTGVGIYNSRISNGDDCISIGPGCSDVEIDGVTCGPSHGISIGSLGVHNSRACVSDVRVRNVVIRESDNGLRIKTWQGGSGTVSGIVFENIQMENVRNCINVDQYYCLTKECMNQSSAVYVTDVQYREIKGTYDVRDTPIHFACSDAVACTNITMSDVELLPHEGELLEDPFCWNAYGLQQTLTIPPIDCLQQGQPQSLMESSIFGC